VNNDSGECKGKIVKNEKRAGVLPGTRMETANVVWKIEKAIK